MTTEPQEPGKAEGAESPAAAIRSLLRRDYGTAADWEAALRDFAQVAKQALRARETLVALYDAQKQTWSACSSDGTMLQDDAIGLYGSRSVLEKVRRTDRPILTTIEEPLLLESESITEHEVQSVLAVPLYFWDMRDRGPQPQRRFAGCLYAHRRRAEGPFTRGDVELVRDLTELAQRTLNILAHVREAERELQEPDAGPTGRRRPGEHQFRLGRYETRDPWFSQNVLEPLRRVSYANRVNLLLLGPSGSGKSHLAYAYHNECPRQEGPFVVLDCSQVLSAETLGPELFGYARDSGYANAPRKGLTGKAELAHGGTLFIDEIATLPAELQQRLLRLIQTGRFSPLGSSEEKHVDIQVIAATNADLAELVRAGRFREDLYQRLREITVHLPPLTRRAADIPFLAEHLLRAALERFGRRDVEGFTEGAIEVLVRHDWAHDGNIRGLEYTINRSVLLAPRGISKLDRRNLQFGDAMDAGTPPAERAEADAREAEAEPAGGEKPEPDGRRSLIERKIREHHGTLASMAADAEVAHAWGEDRVPMALSTLRLRIRKLGLEGLVEAERRRREEALDPQLLQEAIRKHGSATAAAEALGLTRDSLVWHLRKAGLSVREVLARDE